MNFITLSQLPAWLEGGFSKDLRENIAVDGPEEDCLITHSLKLYLVFGDLHDLFKMLDTYIYMQLPRFPREFYDFARGNAYLKPLLFELESGNGPLAHFFELTKTPEYASIKICIDHPISYELLKIAIIKNQMGIIQYLVEDVGFCPETNALFTVVEHGHIHILEYIFSIFPEVKQSFKWRTPALFKAVKNDDVAMLTYLKEKVGTDWKNKDILKAAMDNRRERCAVYLLKQGCKINSTALEIACKMDSLEIIRLIFESGQHHEMASSTIILNYAIRMDRLEIARYLYSKGNKPNELTLLYLADCKNPECRRFAEEICAVEL
jgi:hypothetical protein